MKAEEKFEIYARDEHIKSLEAELEEAREKIEKIKKIQRFSIATYILSPYAVEKEREYEDGGDYVDADELYSILANQSQTEEEQT